MLDLAARTMPVVLLTGARQTGKSTLARLYADAALSTQEGGLRTTEDGEPLSIESSGSIIRYATLDAVANIRLAREAPDSFVQQADVMIIDEVQREPDLLLAIKAAVDTDHPRRPGRFILTGSANLLLLKRVQESLAGRAAYITLSPFTRREQLAFGTAGIWSELLATPPSAWRDLIEAQPSAEEPWSDVARRGGFPTPSYELETSEQRRLWFNGYLRTYLERDVPDIVPVDNLPAFETVLRSMATRTGTIVNQTQLARDAQLPQTTVQRYIANLEVSYQIQRLPAYTASRTKQLVKSPKFYWTDVGLSLFLSREAEPRGEHFETLVACDLFAWQGVQVDAPNVFYWRTPKGAEIDFVIDTGSRLLPIEVKATAQPSTKDMASMRVFLDDYADRAPAGLLLHTGGSTFWIAKNILAAPWWRVL
jgi:predicted AAA+ superfamily ATPase